MNWTNETSYDLEYCRRKIEDFIRKYKEADTVNMVSRGRFKGRPHIIMKLDIRSNKDIIEEYHRLEFLGYLN